MNYKAYLLFLCTTIATQWPHTLYCITTTTAESTFTRDTQRVPWTATFTGINTQPIPPVSTSGPFQASTLPSTENSANNPFYTPPSSLSVQTTQTTAQTITSLLTNPATPLTQKVNAAFNPNTAINGTPLKITAKTKHLITPAAQAISNLGSISFTQLQKQIQQPQEPLFPNNPALTTAYQNFMNAMQNVPSFLPLFRKLHILALHELYTYLTGIYTSLNMTHINDVKTYMLTEKTYALNKKTLIINHLINVIMAQLNQAIRALMPGMPESQAIGTGMLCIQNDKISNPNLLVLDLEKSVLAVIGLESVSSAQVAAAYTALINYSNLAPKSSQLPRLILVSPDSPLATGIQKLNNSIFSTKNFSQAERTALMDALDTINAYQLNTQTTQSLQIISDNLTNPSLATITTQQVAQLSKLITQCTYGQPLAQEIAFCKLAAELLGDGTTPSTTPLTIDQVTTLKGIISFILQKYESNAINQLVNVMQVLGEMNPTYQTLSVSQSLTLAKLAAQLLPSDKQAPVLLLQNLTDTQRQNLAYGLWVTSNTNTNLSTPDKQALQTLATTLKQQPVSQASLTTAQQTALTNTLTTFSQYQLTPLSSADFPNQIQTSLKGLSLTEQDQQSIITQALGIISSTTFKSFNQLTQEEQIVLLSLFQKVDQLFETRLQNHLAQSTELQFLFTQSPAAANALFSSITMAQYEALNAIDAFIETTPGPLSFSMLSQVTPPANTDQTNKKAWMNPTQALTRLFAPPKRTTTATLSTNPFSGLTSYYEILTQLQSQNFQDPTLLELITTLTPETITLYTQALPIVNNANFSIAQLDQTIRTSLITTITNYVELIKKDSTKHPTTRTSSHDSNQTAVELIANVIRFTDQYTSMKSSFLWVLKQYLLFFNLYAQTLQNVSQDPANPQYVGLTEFAEYAQAIQQNLRYESGTKQGMIQLLEQTNPPLFFYNAAVFRGIKLLPKLAKMVEGSKIAPYPTFGIEQAINGTAIDPLTKKPVLNLTSIGESFQYKKFFFLQAPDSTTELTGLQPSWITKISVESSTGPTYLYKPNNIPQDGITGFYMNIPSFQPNATGGVALRLFEQPIIAQPEWLNTSGIDQKVPLSGAIPAESAGIITVLRACLGDFQAALNLGIFDPCLTIIFTTALAIPDSGTEQLTNGTPFTAQDTAACSAYIQEKQALLENQNNATPSAKKTSPQGTLLSLAGANP